MQRFLALPIAVLAALAAAAAALAAGPSYVALGGPGVLAPDGNTRYVAVSTDSGTAIERIRVSDGSVLTWASLDGAWGIPAPTFSAADNEGLTRDGRRLIVATAGAASPTRFAIIGARTMRVFAKLELDGNFAYDALSPDGSTLYLVQHVDVNNLNRYVVRAYDLRTRSLRPGAIADKTQRGWVMEGMAVTRATSTDGRWVYTLFYRPGGYPFVHALDAVNGVAHCVGLPWHGDQNALLRMHLALADDGRTLAVNRGSGRTWLTVNTSNWAITHHGSASAGFPWRWLVVGVAAALGALGLAGAALALHLRRRRHPREVLPAAL